MTSVAEYEVRVANKRLCYASFCNSCQNCFDFSKGRIASANVRIDVSVEASLIAIKDIEAYSEIVTDYVVPI